MTCFAFLALLLVIVACSSSQEFECEKSGINEDCFENSYPYASDCTKFWLCTLGCIPYAMDCPAGLHYSASMKVCESPQAAMCQESTTPTPTPVTTTPGSTLSTPETTMTTIPTTTTPQPTTTTSSGSQPPLDPTIFYVSRLSSRLIRQDPVEYQAVLCDRHNDFNIAENTFITPNPGYYFFHLSVGFRPNTGANYRIEVPGLLGQFANILRDSDAHPGEDTASRDLIASLNTSDPFFVTSTAGGFYSDNQQQTAWGGFSLHNTMDHVAVFSVGRTTGLTETGIVDFDEVGVNHNGDFKDSSDSFIAPVTGMYLVSVSAGAVGSRNFTVQVLVNGFARGQLIRDHTQHTNTDTLSRSVLLNINQGDAVQYELRRGELSSNHLLQTSFSGFLVDPRFTTPRGWFVNRDDSWDGGLGEGALSPVDFNDVIVNEGGLYDSVSHEVTITSPGFYYIHFGGGAMSGQPLELSLILNDSNELANIIRTDGYQTGVDSMSRGYLRAFDSGDVLKIEAAARTSFIGDNFGKFTYFMGIQIYSTE